jgi:hypothetical protein
VPISTLRVRHHGRHARGRPEAPGVSNQPVSLEDGGPRHALERTATRRLLIARRGRRAPGELPRPEQNPTEAFGVDWLIDSGG